MPKVDKPRKPAQPKKLKAAIYNKLRTRMGKRNKKGAGRKFNKREMDSVFGADRTKKKQRDIADDLMKSYGHTL